MFNFSDRDVICKVCLKSFTTKRHNAIYCDDACKAIGARSVNTLNRKSKAANRIPTIYNRNCNYCGSQFTTQLHKQKYCKPECSHQGRLAKRRESAVLDKKANICPHCSFRPITAGFETCNFCRESMRRSSAAKAVERKKSRLCKDCGKPAVSTIYCSDCLAIYNEKNKARTAHRKLNNLCTFCGSELPTAYENLNCRSCLDEHNAFNAEITLQVFTHYGLICSCCGAVELDFLSLDHINNDGGPHRKELTGKAKGGGGITTYLWIIKNNFPIGFQTLCYNCNVAKQSNGGICPHKDILRINMKSDYNKIKTEVFSHYGMKCQCCNEDGYLFLSMDHINGDGASRREEEGTGNALYHWLKRNNYPIDFQILCYNCNTSKGDGAFCSHQRLQI